MESLGATVFGVALMWRYPLGPPRYINFFEPFHFLAGDQLVVPIGGHRTFLYGYKKYNRGSGRKRTNEQNEQYEPGVNSKCKTRSNVTLCIPVSIYRLKLAWISRETFTKLLGMPTYPNRSSSLPWTSSHPTGLSAVRCRLPCPSSVANCLLRVPLSNSLLAFPYPLPVTPRSRVQNPLVSRQNRQKNRLLGGPPT